MNICFLFGKIVSKIEFKFFYNDKKYLSKVNFELENFNNHKANINRICAYNELADKIYSEYEENSFISIVGTIENNEIRILEIE